MENHALITENKKFTAELESEKENLKLLQEAHLEYVNDNDIDQCRTNTLFPIALLNLWTKKLY